MSKDRSIETTVTTILAELDRRERARIEAATRHSAPRLKASPAFAEFKAKFHGLGHRVARTVVSYWSNCGRVGISPLPVTTWKLDALMTGLQAAGKKSFVWYRQEWGFVFDTVPTELYFQIVGHGEELRYRKPKAPTLSEALAELFPELFLELQAWEQEAQRPASGWTDDHESIEKRSCGQYISALARITLHLHDAGLITTQASIEDVLTETNVNHWYEVQTYPDSHLMAILAGLTRIACDTLGSSHPVLGRLTELAAQLEVGRSLTEQEVVKIRHLHAMDCRGELQGLAEALIVVAETASTLAATRINLARVAVGMVIQLEFALRPGDLASVRLTDDGGIYFVTRVKKGEGTIEVSERLKGFLSALRALCHLLGRPVSEFLFATKAGTECMGIDAVDRLLSDALRLAEYDRPDDFCWQTLRDLCAYRLIRDDPTKLLRVADLPDVQTRQWVEIRYGPFLPGGNGGWR